MFFCGVSLPAYAGAIAGVVHSAQSQKPIAGVMVRTTGPADTTYTDEQGRYLLGPLDPGTYTVVFAKDGFEAQSVSDVYVAGEGEKRLDVELLPQVFQLEKMVVRSSAFRKAADMAASTKVMNFDDILRQPGALVDVQRAVQNLPSVASGGDNVNEVVVRGGMPGENQMVMDNVEIPNPNHFAQQGTGGGVVSLINPLLVRGLTFNAGAPPAQYGGKASSVIDVKLRDGNDKIVLGGIDVGLAGVGGHVEGPLWPSAKRNQTRSSPASLMPAPGTFMVSGHRSFLDVASSFQSTVAIPEFWGLQAKVSQSIGNSKFYINGIFGRNTITIENAKQDLGVRSDVIESGGIIYVGALNWDASWGEKLGSNVVFSGTGNTFDRRNFDPAEGAAPADTVFFNGSREQEQTLKWSLSYDFADNSRLMLGAYGRRCDFDIDIQSAPDTLKAYRYDGARGEWLPDSAVRDEASRVVVISETSKRHDVGYKYGGFISAIVRLFERLRVVPGVRADGFDYTGYVNVAPRLSAVYSLTPSVDLTAAAGLQFQDPDYTVLVQHPANRDLKAKMAMSGAGGVEYTAERIGAKFIAEGFYKHYRNVAVDSSLAYADTSLGGRCIDSKRAYAIGRARSFGLELFAQKKLSRYFFATCAYSLSRAQSLDPRPGHEGEWYDGDFDFRHAFTVTGGVKLELMERRWYARMHDKVWFMLLSPIMPVADRMEFSAKWRYLGGRPYTEKKYDYEHQRWYMDRAGALNSSRHDPYHRLDVRWERRYGFGFVHMIYYFDIQNMYNRDNIWQYVYPDGRDTKQPIYQFPFFPVGGMIIGF